MAVTEVSPLRAGSSESPATRVRSLARHRLIVPSAIAAMAAVVFVVIHNALIDDSYITLSYARNLAFHGHWGLIPSEVSNSATAPLNVLLLAAFTVVLRAPVMALGVVFVLANAVTAYALSRAARGADLPAYAGALGALTLLFNPLLLSAVGLEMTVAAALVSLLLLAVVERRPALFGVVAGLLAMTRLDLGVFVAIPLVVFSARLRRGWWKIPLTGAAVALPWYVFSWFALGSAIPDTLIIKQMQKSWGQWDFSNGLWLYFDRYPAATALAVLPALLGLGVLLGWAVTRLIPPTRRAARKLDVPVVFGLAGLAHYLVYVRLDVPPYHWYYAPSLIGLTLCFAFGAGVFAARKVTSIAAGAVCVVLLAAQVSVFVSQGIPWREALITTNGALQSEYARVGNEAAMIVGDKTAAAPPEIGTIAYFCDCNVVDGFADRGYLATQIQERMRQVGPLYRRLLELNYWHFDFTQEPRPVDYRFVGVEGLGPPGAWNTDSVWAPPAHLRIEPVPREQP